MIDFFVYDSMNGLLTFNQPEFLLIKEFAKLYEPARNKCKEDKTGILRLRARKEFTYIWLKYNKKSPYSQYDESESHKDALADSKLTEEDCKDLDFKIACEKYIEIRDSNRIARMLKAVYNKIDDITDYFNNVVNFNERDNSGKPIFKLKDLQSEIKSIGDVIQGVKQLELMYEKDIEESSNSLRANAKAGFKD